MLTLIKHVPANSMSDKAPKKASLNILNQKEFETRIASVMSERYPISMFDAVILYCETNNIEIETVTGLLSSKMKLKLENEAIKERMVIGMPARLSIGD
jgi:predicted nucleic acid-binding protein